jgi:hypothetical protein
VSVSLITLVYSDEDRDDERAMRTIEEVRHCDDCDELLVVDNSPQRQVAYAELCSKIDARYIWNQGYNLHYTGGIEEGIRYASCEAVVYFSSKRGRVYSRRWITAITSPLVLPEVGMAGCLQGMEGAERWFPLLPHEQCQWPPGHVHVQGAVWAARRQVMQENRYSTRWPHVYSDIWIACKLYGSGYQLVDVPFIKAVPHGLVKYPERYGFVADYS